MSKKSTHFHKSSIDEHLDNKKKETQEIASFSDFKNQQTHEKTVEEAILSDFTTKQEHLFNEYKKVRYIVEDIMTENEVWEEQYDKLKEVLTQKEMNNLNIHELYEKNFITKITEFEQIYNSKEIEFQNLTKIIRNLERENNNLRLSLDNVLTASPTLRKDLKKKLEELEKQNLILNNEMNLLERKETEPKSPKSPNSYKSKTFLN